MPAYNFQSQFVPMILDGQKPHTIRKRRERPTKVGDMLWLYTGMRTKQCILIASSVCVKVQPITIMPYERILFYEEKDGRLQLGSEGVDRLAKMDGFENRKDFFGFFERYGKPLLEDFEIIWWDVNQLDINPLAVANESAGVSGVCSLGYNWKAG